MSLRLICALALCLASASTASAKPTREDPLARDARTAYEEGITEYNLGHYAEALQAFERGYRVKHDPAFLFNIGQCQRQLHHPREAAQSYRAYLRESQTAAGNRAEVEKLVATMDQEVAREIANQPPMGVTSPTEPPARAEPAVVVTQPAPPPPPKRRTGLWIGLGVGGAVVVGLAVGLGVGLGASSSNAPASSLGTMTVAFQ